MATEIRSAALRVGLLLATFLCVIGPATGEAGIRYEYTALPAPAPAWNTCWFQPVDINNKSEVAGMTWTTGYVWRPATGYSIISLPASTYYFTPAGINDFSQIAGQLDTYWGKYGAMKDPATGWHTPSNASGANAVNAHGEIVGVVPHTYGGYGTYWAAYDAAPVQISNARWSSLSDINASGRACGNLNADDSIDRALTWTLAGGIHYLAPLSGCTNARANEISNANQVVGASWASGGTRPVMWGAGGTPGDLGGFGGDGEALGVNNCDQVVGYSKTTTGDQRAFVYINNQMFDLNTMVPAGTPTLRSAVAINDLGQIVGAADSVNGFFLSPVYMDNGNFEASLTTGWSVSGPGTAATVDQGGGQYAACLTAGSPVTLSQDVATPVAVFELAFDYEFLGADPACTLTVELDSVLLDTLTAPPALVGDWTRHTILVDDPALIGLDAAELAFTYDGPTGTQILLDNVELTQLPEPGSVALLILGGLGALLRRKRG